MTLAVPASTRVNMSSNGALFMTIVLISWPALPGSPPGHAIGATPRPLNFSHSARKPSQSAGAPVPARASRSPLTSGMLNTYW